MAIKSTAIKKKRGLVAVQDSAVHATPCGGNAAVTPPLSTPRRREPSLHCHTKSETLFLLAHPLQELEAGAQDALADTLVARSSVSQSSLWRNTDPLEALDSPG